MDPQSDDRVVQLLGGLKKVNAPDSFESRVKARLSRPRVSKSSFGFLKLAIPTAALAVLALFLFLSGYIGEKLPQVDVVTAVNEKPVTPEGTPSQSAPILGQVPRQSQEFRDPEVTGTRPSPDAVEPSAKIKRNLDRIRSYDIGSEPKDKVILPPGFDPDKRATGNANSEKEMRRPSIPASDLLRYVGVTTESRGGELAVNSVVPNSVAERIGLKTGDIIVALNEIQLGRSTAFPSGVDLKTIRVRRGSDAIELKF